MSLRGWINNHPTAVGIATIVLRVTAVVVAFRFTRQPPRQNGPFPVYVFHAESGRFEPGTSADNRLRAFVFACGECTPQNLFLGFVGDDQGNLRLPDQTQWHSGLSPEGRAIQAQPEARCQAQGKPLRRCLP